MQLDISHLLFAYGTLDYCGANQDHIRALSALFLCFEVVSSLELNLAKSEMVLVGNVLYVENVASILKHKVLSLPMKYLGLLQGVSFKSKAIWDEIIEKMERRSASL